MNIREKFDIWHKSRHGYAYEGAIRDADTARRYEIWCDAFAVAFQAG